MWREGRASGFPAIFLPPNFVLRAKFIIPLQAFVLRL
jgi:hypothetical protein